MSLTFIGVLTMSVALIFLIISVSYLLGHADMIFGFENETKETDAIIKKFITRGMDTIDNPKGAHPIIEYYNEFLGQYIEKEMFNSGIIASKDAAFKNEKQRVANIGDKVKVQYTAKKVRVIDSKFVTPNKYKIARFVIPIIASIVCGFIGFLMLIISII